MLWFFSRLALPGCSLWARVCTGGPQWKRQGVRNQGCLGRGGCSQGWKTIHASASFCELEREVESRFDGSVMCSSYRYPTFVKPYLACLHSSPITSSHHCHNCPSELWDKIIAAGREHMTDEHSSKVLHCLRRSFCFAESFDELSGKGAFEMRYSFSILLVRISEFSYASGVVVTLTQISAYILRIKV